MGQGTARAVGLRRATMDYLNRRCPGRRELSRLVALRWGLHDSAAALWEIEAKQTINNFIEVAKLDMQNTDQTVGSLGLLTINANDPATVKILENSMSCLTTAVQHHLLTDCHNSAQKAASLAELVALQLGLISQSNTRVFCIFELTSEQYAFLIGILKFPEAKILSTCYNYPTDWSQALYNQCIVKSNHEEYLAGFLEQFEMTEVLGKDIVRKYLIDKSMLNKKIPVGLRLILNKIKSPVIKYRLASELGLKDVVQSMLEGPIKPYLEDTVWKTGCPPPNL